MSRVPRKVGVRGGASSRNRALALVVGPSAGHFYAGEYGHAIGMTTVRAAGAITGLIAVLVTTIDVEDGSRDDNDHQKAWAIAAAGAGVYLATTLYDLLDAHLACRRTVAPMALAGGAGLMVAGSF